MLNRNDRIALRRNRSAVSWLILLIIVLTVWLITSIKDVTSQREDYTILLIEMNDIQSLNDRKGRIIDSLVKVINYKQVDTPVIKKPFLKLPVKKDTSTVYHKVDSTKSVKKDFILKDTLK
jgi:hypothetical protein